jgi:hypothetical protein
MFQSSIGSRMRAAALVKEMASRDRYGTAAKNSVLKIQKKPPPEQFLGVKKPHMGATTGAWFSHRFYRFGKAPVRT